MSQESTTSSASGAHLQPRPVPVNGFKDVRPVLHTTLNQLDNPFIRKLEELSGLDREKLFCIGISLMALYVMFGPGNMLVSTLIGVVYPLCASLTALNTQNASEFTQWLVYWIVFAKLCPLDFLVTSAALRPLYLLLKTTLLLFLALPQTYGAHNIYVKFSPLMTRWMKKMNSKAQ